jgi:peptidoglycan/xylan/chitin deacetylase (PgdA/CDA1 family)
MIRGGLEAIALAKSLHIAPDASGQGLIFTLHHVRPAGGSAFSPNAHLGVTPQFLSAAILETQRMGYQAVHLDELPDHLTGSVDGRRFVAFTLDDGYRDNLVHAAPVFHRHGVPFTVFVTKGFVDRSRTIWWETAEALTRAVDYFAFDFGQGEEIVNCHAGSEKHLAFNRLASFVDSHDEDEAVRLIDSTARKNGIDPMAIVDREIMTVDELRELIRDPLARLGGHTVTHCNLARVTADRLRREIVNSLDAIRSWTGHRPETFAYPYGFARACGEREAQAAADAGVRVAVTTQPGVLDDPSLSRLGLLPRVSLNGLYQKPRYVRALLTGLPIRLTL